MEGAETLTKIESENFKLQNDEYLLTMALYSDDFIEFKLIQNSPNASCYYIEKFNFEKITDISNLNPKKLDMKKVYHIYQRILKNEKINIILSQDKNIITINYKISANYEEEDVNLELKKMELEKEDIIDILKKEVEKNEKKMEELQKENEKMKKDLDFLMGEYNKKIEKEEKEKQLQKEAEEKEKQLQKEEEELSSKNDNVNLINYFKCDNIKQMQNIDSIAIPNACFSINNAAVYCIIKNNERLYQIAFSYLDYNKNFFIMIYDLFKKKEENFIHIGHGNNICKIQHYYNPSKKIHMLLCSCYKNIQIWDISSNPVINILKIDISCAAACCVMFKNDRLFLYGYNYNNKSIGCWDENGTQINTNNINFSCSLMETTYIENKIYILMDGSDSKSYSYYAQCYDVAQNEFFHYKNNNDKSSSQITCINLFNKGNKIDDIDLIVCKSNRLEVFNFKNKNLIREILIDDIQSLNTINQNYIFVTVSGKIKIIDKEYSFLNEEYSRKNEYINGLNKIKIPEIGECIVTFSGPAIQLWKIQ